MGIERAFEVFKFVFLLFMALHCSVSYGQEIISRAMKCTELSSNVKRLECYDMAFREERRSIAAVSFPPLWYARVIQESQRGDKEGPILGRHNGSVIITIPASINVNSPTILIACVDGLTYFQIHMSTPVNARKIDIAFISDFGVIKSVLRARYNGYVLSVGRGLSAISLIKDLLGSEVVLITSDDLELNNRLFKITGLPQYLEPLRAKCDW